METTIEAKNAKVNDSEFLDYYGQGYCLFPIKKTLDFYDDISRGGWLKVPLKDIERLGLQKAISDKSYHKGDFAYLNHEYDMRLYALAMLTCGYRVAIHYHNSKQGVTHILKGFQFVAGNVNVAKLKNELEQKAHDIVDLAVEKKVFEIQDGEFRYTDGKTDKDFLALVG